MDNKKQLGQFYTKDFSLIADLVPLIESKKIVDPFAGAGDLVFCKNMEGYDIDPKNPIVKKRDTLIHPLDYSECAIVSNPPYLAKNKAVDKTIFNHYSVDDLYKASIESIMTSQEGVLILPINFFSSERGEGTRKKFLSKYVVKKVKVFEQRVFDDTDYCVCAFYYTQSNGGLQSQEIEFNFIPSNETRLLTLNVDNNFYLGIKPKDLPKSSYKVSRLTDNTKDEFISNIKIYAIDATTESGKIRAEITEPFYGKQSDRTYATLVFDKPIEMSQQEQIVKRFNDFIATYRHEYKGLCLSNYRNSASFGGRKRISFTLVYSIIHQILLDMEL